MKAYACFFFALLGLIAFVLHVFFWERLPELTDGKLDGFYLNLPTEFWGTIGLGFFVALVLKGIYALEDRAAGGGAEAEVTFGDEV